MKNNLIWSLVIVMLFSITCVSAFSISDLDNKVYYSNNDLKVDFKNSVLGIFPTSEIGSVELKSHKTADEFLEVPAGNPVPMFYDFNNFKEVYPNGLGTVEFTDMKTGLKVQRDYHFVYWKTEIKNRPIWTQECVGYSTNKSQYCYWVTYENEQYESGDWADYDSKDIPAEKIRIGIRVEVRPFDTIDGVWTIAGKKVTRHSVWTATLNSQLVSYWTLNETTGTFFDSLGRNNFTTVVALHNATGKINFSAQFNGSNSHITTTTMGFPNASGTSFTLNHWVYLNTTGNNIQVLGWQDSSGSARIQSFVDISKFLFRSNVMSGGDLDTGVSATVGSWFMITYRYNNSATNISTWTNCNYRTSEASTYNANSGNIFIVGEDPAGSFDFNGSVDEIAVWNRSLTDAEICDLYNAGSGITYQSFQLNVLSLSPQNGATLNNPTVNLSVNVSDTGLVGVKNVSLLINGTINQTNTSFLQGYYQFLPVIPDGFWNYTFEAYDNLSNRWTSSNGTLNFTVSSTPQMNVLSPQNTTYINPTIYFNATNSSPVSYWIVNYNGTNITLSNINTTLNVEDGFFNLKLYANSTSTGTFGLNNSIYFTKSQFIENSDTFNASSFETKNESFYVNITSNGSTPANANLIYNGSVYPATVTNIAGNVYNFSRTIDIPTLNGTKNFYWNFTLGGVGYNTSTQSQTITSTVFVLCNATWTDDFLNISFQDELTLASINASVPASTFVYYIGSGGVNKTLSISNSSTNYNYTFCASPTTEHFSVQPTFNYRQVSTYPQRTWSPSLQNYNSTVFNQILYLLSVNDGQQVTIQVVNPAFQPLQGVLVNVTTSGSGLLYNTTTDAAGSVTFFLNPTVAHTFGYFLSGYDALIQTIFPTQSTYTVTLGATSSNVTYDYNRGINYTITPTNSSLFNNTVYNFTFALNSSYWTPTNFGFALVNSTGSTLNSTVTNSSSGISYVTFNTTNLSMIRMNYFWLINGTYSNASRTWNVIDSGGTGSSIANFFSDLSTYAGQGIFGIDNFGLALISFLVIFIGTGILSYKFGITSPETIAGAMFFLTAFLNVGIDIIPLGTSAFRYFPTVLMGIIFIGMFFREVSY